MMGCQFEHHPPSCCFDADNAEDDDGGDNDGPPSCCFDDDDAGDDDGGHDVNLMMPMMPI